MSLSFRAAEGFCTDAISPDVVEIDKENKFTLGRVLRVSDKYSYSDLDELLILHVKSLANKVNEMIAHEKYHGNNEAELQ